MTKVVTHGKGIRERYEWQPENSVEAQEMFQEMGTAGRPTFRKKVDLAIAWAETVLSPEQRPGGSATKIHVEDSDEGNALLILKMTHWIQQNINDGDAEAAAMQALDLGLLLARLDIARRWQKTTLAGEGASKGGRKGSAERWGHDTEEKHARIREALAQGVSPTQIAAAENITPRQIRRLRADFLKSSNSAT